MSRSFTIGLLAALTGNVIWGCFPFYFKELTHISPAEILDHRIWTSALFTLFWLPFANRAQAVWRAITNPRTISILILTSALITGNWFFYIITVANGQVLQASLGYYLAPLLTVGFSALVLREKQSPLQLVAVGIACVAVAGKFFVSGQLPTYALILGLTFSLYSLLRKQLAVGPISGLFIEACIALPFALAHMAWLHSQGDFFFLTKANLSVDLLILGLGIVSIMPLFFTT